MAMFRLGDDNTAPFTFLGGKHAGKLLKKKEAGLGVVSPVLQFGICATQREGPWVRFAAELEAMCGQRQMNKVEKDSKDSGGTEPRNAGFRVAVCSPVKLNWERNEGQPKHARCQVPMKVLLISDIDVNQPIAQRERGFLAQLTRICGSENVIFRIEGLNVVNKRNPNEPLRLQLSWNEQDLCWETAEPVEMNFKTNQLRNFGQNSGQCIIYIGSIKFELTTTGVCKVLQRKYGKRGDNWDLQQQNLETGELSNMQIICDGSKDLLDLKPIKCHRLQLVGASPVFARMLADNQGQKWKESETRTLQLPESEQAIVCMLHFFYYGGCEKILQSPMDVILELLEAGEKYEVPGLIDIATFVLMADIHNDNWFTLDGAVKLYQYATLFGRGVWEELKKRSNPNKMIQARNDEEGNGCAGYQKLREIAVKLGPVFEYMLEQDYGSESTWIPTSLPIVDSSRVTLEEARFMYGYFSFGQDFQKPRNLDVGIGVLMLAEFCGGATPTFANRLAKRFLCSRSPDHGYEADYLLDLYFQARDKQGNCWQNLKTGAVKCLRRMGVAKPKPCWSHDSKYQHGKADKA